jgi:hypothetical protein
MVARIVSLLIAVIASAIGLPLLWTGGLQLLVAEQRFGSGDAPVGAALLAGLGIVFVGVAVATISLSSLGAIVVGALHLVAAVAVPIAFTVPGTIVAAPVRAGMSALSSIDPPLAVGAVTFISQGPSAVIGVVLVVAGIAVTRRRGPAGAVARGLLGSLSALLVLLGGALALGAGAALGSSLMVRLEPDTVAGTVMVVGLVLVAVGAVLVRWTALGVGVAGAVLALLGLVATIAADPVWQLATLVGGLPAAALVGASPSVYVVGVGVALLLVGVAIGIRERRLAARIAVATDTGIIQAQIAAHEAAGEGPTTFPGPPPSASV